MQSFDDELELGYGELEYDGEGRLIPEVEITKEDGIYYAYNIKKPEKKFSFKTKEELFAGIGVPPRKHHQFKNLTGELIFLRG